MYLEDIKVGDSLWSPTYGWGYVSEIDKVEVFGLKVVFEKVIVSFTHDGRGEVDAPAPDIFLDIPEMYKTESYPKSNGGWRAELGGRYYFISSGGKVLSYKEEHAEYNDELFNVGNYFKTKEIAKKSRIYKAFRRKEEDI